MSAEETSCPDKSDDPTLKIPTGMCCLSDGLPRCHWSLGGGQLGWASDKVRQNWPSHFLAWVPASLGFLVPSGWCLGSCVGLYLTSQGSGLLSAAHTGLSVYPVCAISPPPPRISPSLPYRKAGGRDVPLQRSETQEMAPMDLVLPLSPELSQGEVSYLGLLGEVVTAAHIWVLCLVLGLGSLHPRWALPGRL